MQGRLQRRRGAFCRSPTGQCLCPTGPGADTWQSSKTNCQVAQPSPRYQGQHHTLTPKALQDSGHGRKVTVQGPDSRRPHSTVVICKLRRQQCRRELTRTGEAWYLVPQTSEPRRCTMQRWPASYSCPLAKILQACRCVTTVDLHTSFKRISSAACKRSEGAGTRTGRGETVREG